MRALLLAAGRGSRMRELTEDGPKCTVPLAGRRLIDWQRSALQRAGCTELAVVTGYRAERLAGAGLRLFHNPEWAATNMVVSLLCASEWFARGPVVVSYSDIVYHPRIVEALIGEDDDLVITFDRRWLALWSERFADPLADAESFAADGDGRLVDIGRRGVALDQVSGQYMGLLRIGPAAFARIAALARELDRTTLARLDMTTLLQRMLRVGETIRAVGIDGGWCEVDSAEDLALYETRLTQAERWSHDFRWE